MNSFIQQHAAWLESHLRKRKGERKDRLKRGHAHAEKLFLKTIWWHLLGHFDGLHPEYEVVDWRGMKFFVDFMWCIGNIKIAFEIKGYGPHVEQADRRSYRRELNRELFLQGLGIQVVSIPYDELEENPDLIRSLIKMIIAPYSSKDQNQFNRVEQDLLKLVVRLGRNIRPVNAVRELGINHRTAVKYLKRLTDQGKFRAIISERSGKVVRYEYIGPMLERI